MTLFFFFSGLHLQHEEVPRLRVESDLWLLAYATAMRDPGRGYDLHHCSQQRQILNALSEARDGTHTLTDTSRIRFHCATMGTPNLHFLRQERDEPRDKHLQKYPSILQDRNNNRHEANTWYLSAVYLRKNGNDRIRRGAEPRLGRRTKRSHTPHPQSQGALNYTRTESPLGQKGRGCQAVSLDNLPAVLCFRIHRGQKMRTQIGEGPGSGQV